MIYITIVIEVDKRADMIVKMQKFLCKGVLHLVKFQAVSLYLY